MTIKLDRERTQFVSPEMLFNFPCLFPGQAEDSMTAGSKSYKIEGGITPQALQAEPALLQAMSYVAQAHAPNNWEQQVWNKLPLLHQTKRDASKYPYYEGMHILNASMVLSLASLKMKDINLAIPEHRMRYDEAIAAKAPGAVKFCNPNNPADLAKIEQMNRDRALAGLTIIPESEYHKTTIKLAPHEIWSGCKGRLFGRIYWGVNQKPQQLGIAFDLVLLTDDTGPRLAGGAPSADAAFGNFAPAAALAPTAPVGFTFPGMPAAPAYPGPAVFTPPTAPAQIAPAQFAMPGFNPAGNPVMPQFPVTPPAIPQQQDPFKNLA